MTTEDDFHAILDSQPDDWQTRLVFADWLDERNDPRGPGIRALGVYRRKAMACQITGGPLRYILGTVEITPIVHFNNWIDCLLPVDWFAAVPISLLCDNKHDKWRYYVTRREAEDAAALGFQLLAVARQTELLEGHVPLKPVKAKKPRAKRKPKSE